MCKLKMKVISCTFLIAMLAIIAKTEALENSKKMLTQKETTLLISKDKEVENKFTEDSKTKDKEVHKRGIFHSEGIGHYATYPTQYTQQGLWPKSYASQYGYSFRPVGLSAFGPSFYRQKPLFSAAAAPALFPSQHAVPHAHPYVLRPGGATVSSYSATYPRYHARPVYTVPNVGPIQPFVPAVQPMSPQAIPSLQPSYSVQPVATPPPQQHQYFFQTQFVPPTPAQAPVFTAQQALPQYPPIAFTPQSPTFLPNVPQIPAIPQAPPIPNVPTPQTPPPQNIIFPFNFQPPVPQHPPTFGGFPNFGSAGQNPVDSGSAVASPQIPFSPQAPQAPQPEPELPPIQSPPTQSQVPWRPVYTASTPPANEPRPPITLQPPYGVPSSGYLPPSSSSQSQSQVQQYQVNENYYDELSDAEIDNIFQQAKYVPHHSQHLQRQSGVVYQHHY